jgi:hypothetical protein
MKFDPSQFIAPVKGGGFSIQPVIREL